MREILATGKRNWGIDEFSDLLLQYDRAGAEEMMNSTDTTDKPFMIDQRLVYEVYKSVKSNGAEE